MKEEIARLYDYLFLNKDLSKRISVFVSGVEAVGTSWCALSVARAMNIEKKRVLLIDGNGDFSNLASYLPLNSPQYLENYIDGKKTLNQLLNAYRNKDFNILTGKTGEDYLLEQPLGRIHIYADDIKILAENYDCTLIDLGTKLNEKNVGLYQIAGNIIILCSDDNTDLIKTFELVKFINELSVPANYYLIINKVNSFEDGYKVYEKLNKALEKNGLKAPSLLGIIRIDTRIRDTLKNKELLLDRYPTSEAATDICNIAKKLYMEL